MDFSNRLNQLDQEVYNFITEKVHQKKQIILFSESQSGDGNWDKEIYEDIPDFAYYDRPNGAEWAAIKEIYYTDDGKVEIHGILKGDSYPQAVVVLLDEFSAICKIELADYIANQK